MLETSFGQLQDWFGIPLTTDEQAFPAQDAASRQQIKIGVLDDGKVQPLQLFELGVLEPNPQQFCYLLQFTTPLGQAVLALHVVSGHEQLKIDSLELPHHPRIGSDHHPLSDSLPAGGQGPGRSFDFYKAQSARACRIVHFFEVAEVGDVNIIFEAYLKEVSSFLRLKLLSIDNK